jgi:hypothetical protein
MAGVSPLAAGDSVVPSQKFLSKANLRPLCYAAIAVLGAVCYGLYLVFTPHQKILTSAQAMMAHTLPPFLYVPSGCFKLSSILRPSLN